MRGASLPDAERICTLPRLVGLRLHTLAVNASKRCSGSPKASSESGWTWYSRFGCGSSGRLRVKAPSCDGAMLIGPLRFQAYSRPIFALPQSELARRVQRLHALDAEDRADLQVVLQVLADAGRSRRTAIPCACSSGAGPMPESCRICGVPIAPVARTTSPPGASLAVSAAPPPAGATRTPARPALGVELDLADVGAGPDLQVRPALDRPQERLGRVPADAGALVDLEVADALVVAAVEVVGVRDAGLLRGRGEGVEHVPAQALLLDPPLAAGTLAGRIEPGRGVERVGAPVEVLVLEEVGQALRPSSSPGWRRSRRRRPSRRSRAPGRACRSCR